VRCWTAASVLSVIALAVVYFTPFLRYESITSSRAEVQERTEQVRKRAEAIKKKRAKELHERRLTEPHAKQLTEKIEKQHRREMAKQLREVEQLRQRLNEAREQRSAIRKPPARSAS